MAIKDRREEKRICEDIIRVLDKPQRLIDADEAYKILTDYYHQRTEIQHKALKEAFERVPTVDAVPVVRCKNCKFWRNDDCQNDNHGYCPISENDFCSWGERREDGQD